MTVNIFAYLLIFLNPAARELFLDRGARPRAPKSGTRNKGLRWDWSVFLSRKQAFSKKKVFDGFGAFFLSRKQAFSKKCLRRIWERFLVPKMAQDTGLRGAKVAQRAKIFPGGRGGCPTSRAYV